MLYSFKFFANEAVKMYMCVCLQTSFSALRGPSCELAPLYFALHLVE